VSTPSVGYVAPAWGTIFPASALLHVRPAVNGGTTVIALRQNGASCFRIGSDHTQSDLVVATERVAPLHAVLQWRGDSQTTFVYDLGSSAGSLIDEQRLTPHEYHGKRHV
jgi:pSer/pThr/pTyr-binding forkhead associated (FHA) protein